MRWRQSKRRSSSGGSNGRSLDRCLYLSGSIKSAARTSRTIAHSSCALVLGGASVGATRITLFVMKWCTDLVACAASALSFPLDWLGKSFILRACLLHAELFLRGNGRAPRAPPGGPVVELSSEEKLSEPAPALSANATGGGPRRAWGAERGERRRAGEASAESERGVPRA